MKRLLLILALLTFSAPLFATVPTDISGLQVWFKADTGTSCSGVCANNGTLSGWTDQSGLGNSMTQVCGSGGAGQTAPIYHTNRQNGLPAVTFDGAHSCFEFTAINLKTASTIFVVYKNASTAAEGTLIAESGLANGAIAYWTVLGGKQQGADKEGVTQLGAGSASQDTSIHQANMTYDNTTVTFRLDKSADGSAAPAATITQNNNAIGANSGTSAFLNADLFEIFAYNTVLSGANIAAMESYICNKYAINGCTGTAGSSIVGKASIVGGTVIH